MVFCGPKCANVAVQNQNIEALKLLLNHPNLTALTLNQKDKENGATPVMDTVMYNSWEPWDPWMWDPWICRSEHLALLVADPRVDLDTTDNSGMSLSERARWTFVFHSQNLPSTVIIIKKVIFLIVTHHNFSREEDNLSKKERAELFPIIFEAQEKKHHHQRHRSLL